MRRRRSGDSNTGRNEFLGTLAISYGFSLYIIFNTVRDILNG